jgi:catechol 2,3-dioxygenase-like lactoylglutathione lyase family enzyme
MAEDIRFDSVAPVIPVRDLDAALERYRRLGFTVHAYEGAEHYGYAERGSVSLHLSETTTHEEGREGAEIYLYVSDADALHAQWKASDVEGRLTRLHDTPYGLREFAYVDPDGTAHRVGSPVTTPTPSPAGPARAT